MGRGNGGVDKERQRQDCGGRGPFQTEERRRGEDAGTKERAEQRRGKPCEPDEKHDREKGKSVGETAGGQSPPQERRYSTEKRQMHPGKRHDMAQPSTPEPIGNRTVHTIPAAGNQSQKEASGLAPTVQHLPERQSAPRTETDEEKKESVPKRFPFMDGGRTHSDNGEAPPNPLSHRSSEPNPVLHDRAAGLSSGRPKLSGKRRLHDSRGYVQSTVTGRG